MIGPFGFVSIFIKIGHDDGMMVATCLGGYMSPTRSLSNIPCCDTGFDTYFVNGNTSPIVRFLGWVVGWVGEHYRWILAFSVSECLLNDLAFYGVNNGVSGDFLYLKLMEEFTHVAHRLFVIHVYRFAV